MIERFNDPDHARTARYAGLVAGALACLLAASGPASAQVDDPSDERPEATNPADPCRAQPDDQKPTENGQDEPPDGASRPKLEDCNGVLTPPKTGDSEIEEPPPDTGTTPVIPPGAVPEQPPE